jgi:hypothetical protein
VDTTGEDYDYPDDTTLSVPSDYTTDAWVNQNTEAFGGYGFALKIWSGI